MVTLIFSFSFPISPLSSLTSPPCPSYCLSSQWAVLGGGLLVCPPLPVPAGPPLSSVSSKALRSTRRGFWEVVGSSPWLCPWLTLTRAGSFLLAPDFGCSSDIQMQRLWLKNRQRLVNRV